MDLGKDIEDSVIEEKMAAQKPNQCATLVYTVRNSLLQLMSCFTLLSYCLALHKKVPLIILA